MAPKVRLHWEGKSENWLAPTPPLTALSIFALSKHVEIAHGDNVFFKHAFPELEEKAQLVYLDPPFFTQRLLSSVLRKNLLRGYTPQKRKIYMVILPLNLSLRVRRMKKRSARKFAFRELRIRLLQNSTIVGRRFLRISNSSVTAFSSSGNS
jgi:hypothetical protein